MDSQPYMDRAVAVATTDEFLSSLTSTLPEPAYVSPSATQAPESSCSSSYDRPSISAVKASMSSESPTTFAPASNRTDVSTRSGIDSSYVCAAAGEAIRKNTVRTGMKRRIPYLFCER